ncbi:MAG: hypothetical protein DDT34_02469 [Firmicutes bacterium]|nr:hypothetical protein [Bacillota bacterium]
MGGMSLRLVIHFPLLLIPGGWLSVGSWYRERGQGIMPRGFYGCENQEMIFVTSLLTKPLPIILLCLLLFLLLEVQALALWAWFRRA